MRILITVILLTIVLFECGSRNGSENPFRLSVDDSTRQSEKVAAIKSFNSGKFYLPETRSYRFPAYVEEGFYALYGVKAMAPLPNDVVGIPPSYRDSIMDSLIVAKFGSDAFNRAQLFADNLHSEDPARYGNECFFAPTYIPNEDSMRAHLQRHVKYPASARRDSVSGVVYVELDIDSAGAITGARVKKSVRSDLDSAPMVGVLKLGKFRTETRWGMKQSGKLILPVHFAFSD